MCAQSLLITGTYEKVLLYMLFILLFVVGTKVGIAKKLLSKVKGSFESQTNNAKIFWKCQIQQEMQSSPNSISPLKHKSMSAIVVQKTFLMFDFK